MVYYLLYTWRRALLLYFWVVLYRCGFMECIKIQPFFIHLEVVKKQILCMLLSFFIQYVRYLLKMFYIVFICIVITKKKYSMHSIKRRKTSNMVHTNREKKHLGISRQHFYIFFDFLSIIIWLSVGVRVTMKSIFILFFRIKQLSLNFNRILSVKSTNCNDLFIINITNKINAPCIRT